MLMFTGFMQNDEMQGKNLRKTGVYTVVHEGFEQVFNTAVLIMRKSWLRKVFLMVGVLWSVTAYALTIEITQGVTQARPIGMAPFLQRDSNGGELADLPVSIDEVIENDLTNSGYFSFLTPRGGSESPAVPQNLDLAPWLKIGAENAISGKVERTGNDRYRVEFVLFDVFKAFSDPHTVGPSMPTERSSRSGVLMTQTIDNLSGKQLRSVAHHISDVIFEALTGVPGAFSTRIAYVMVMEDQKPRRSQLVVADADGYNPHVLVDSKEPLMSPSWSPDGKKIAFVSFERFRAEIYVIDAMTGKRERVSAFPGINGAPAWSPDGNQLALVLSKGGSPNIYLYDMKSKQLTQLTSGFSIDTEPCFSPDARKLLFTSNRGGSNPQIYEMDLGSKNVKRLTFQGGYNARASYTPDGKKIVMIHRDSNGVYRIAIQNLESGELNLLTNARLDESPSIAPNGTMVLYGTQVSDRRMLGAVSVDGRIKLRLPAKEGSVQEPAWSPFLTRR